MTRTRWTRGVGLLLAGGFVVFAIGGCGGGGDFKDKPRPAIPIQLSSVVTDKAVSVEPSKVGAGPVTIVVSNQSTRSHTVTLQGGPHNTVEQVGPINHAFPHFGLAAGLMYLPAKFKIRFLEPISLDGYEPADAEDLELVQSLAEDVRERIQTQVDELISSRTSVWFG